MFSDSLAYAKIKRVVQGHLVPNKKFITRTILDMKYSWFMVYWKLECTSLYNTTFCIFTYTGSGGNNHAVDYYEQTKYPLAVKLGTITPDGADVYSYDEDDMVEDPKLSLHLAHFGIDITSMTKVDIFGAK